MSYNDNSRPILVDSVSSDGLFTVPEKISAEDEVRYAKRRQDSIRISQYADSKCGIPATFDKDGGYLCGGRADGSSSPCNKLVGTECLIYIKPIDDMHHQSCGMWEVKNAGDPEGRYCPKGKLDAARIGFGSTKSELGFSCQRCIYYAQMSVSDSEGRDDFCRLKGHPVEDNACCEDNEPIAGEADKKKKRLKTTQIDHEEDGSHTVTHEYDNGNKEKWAATNIKQIIDGMKSRQENNEE